MSIKKGKVYELEIADLAFGGKGVAKIDGLAVFVDQAAPGDMVSARVFKKKKNFAEARIVETISPSPLRIEPPCPYSGFCGGCKWQFLPYETQLQYKTNHVREALEHIGGIKDVPVNPAEASPDMFGYRNKMEFSCSDRRWLLPEQMDDDTIDISFALGLHVPGTFHKVLDIDACLLQASEGNQILNDAKRYMKNSGVPVYGLKSHVGFWRFLMLRHSVARDQWMVNIITSSEDRAGVEPLAKMLMEKYPSIVSVVNNITARKAGVAVGEYEIHLAGQPVIEDQIGPNVFEISANSFFQTNTRGAEILYGTVERFAELTGKESVLDLYSGTGTIPIHLSKQASRILGIEIVESAVRGRREKLPQKPRGKLPVCSGRHPHHAVGRGIAPRPDDRRSPPRRHAQGRGQASARHGPRTHRVRLMQPLHPGAGPGPDEGNLPGFTGPARGYVSPYVPYRDGGVAEEGGIGRWDDGEAFPIS